MNTHILLYFAIVMNPPYINNNNKSNLRIAHYKSIINVFIIIIIIAIIFVWFFTPNQRFQGKHRFILLA